MVKLHIKQFFLKEFINGLSVDVWIVYLFSIPIHLKLHTNFLDKKRKMSGVDKNLCLDFLPG